MARFAKYLLLLAVICVAMIASVAVISCNSDSDDDDEVDSDDDSSTDDDASDDDSSSDDDDSSTDDDDTTTPPECTNEEICTRFVTDCELNDDMTGCLEWFNNPTVSDQQGYHDCHCICLEEFTFASHGEEMCGLFQHCTDECFTAHRK